MTSFNLKIFLEELDRLEEAVKEVEEAAKPWLWHQNDRQTWGNTDQYAASAARLALEEKLMVLRERMAIAYDFQGDRGLVNFEPTGLASPEDHVVIE